MQISDLTVEVRNSSLARVGQILPGDLIGFEAALRFNKVGSWKISLRSDHPLVDTLRSPGGGLIVTGPTGVLISGPTASATNIKTASDPTGVWEIIGTDDAVILGERLAYPVPTTADLSLQDAAYDTRTGASETVAKAYVNANIGPSAATARKITNLTVDTDLGRGSTVRANARFDKLGELVYGLLTIDGLGFDVKQVGSNLVFEVFQPVDRSSTIRMDVDNLLLTKSEYTYTAPAATRVIVAGQGEGAARVLLERSSTASTTAESLWGRRIEIFKDARNSSESTALQNAGDEILSVGGKTVEGIKVTPSDDQSMRYSVDWGLGDKVTIVVGSSQIVQVVTEVAIVITGDGIKVGATVGDAVAAGDGETSMLNASTDQEARISNLERNEDGVGTQNIVQYVKNNTGSTLTKGQAVYIAGASGSNITVALAQANAEATSSKTLGLLKQDLANGEQGYVIVEGTLEGLDTSARTAGEAMWLSPTTAGGIVYGLAGKPSAPNHMVYLGVVKRIQSNNGSVYVKVQNGFELEELHNVAITSPADNNLLAYDSATSLWTNQTAAEAGVSEVGHAHAGSDITSGTVATARFPSGTILQTQSVTLNTQPSTTSNTAINIPGLSISITPRSTSSKFYLQAMINNGWSGSTGGWTYFNFARSGTNLIFATAGTGANTFANQRHVDNGSMFTTYMSYLDSPGTAGAITYTVRWSVYSSNTATLNKRWLDAYFAGSTTFTVFEVAG